MDTSNNNSPASPGREGGGGSGGLEDDTTATAVNAQPGRRGGQVSERIWTAAKIDDSPAYFCFLFFMTSGEQNLKNRRQVSGVRVA